MPTSGPRFSLLKGQLGRLVSQWPLNQSRPCQRRLAGAALVSELGA